MCLCIIMWCEIPFTFTTDSCTSSSESFFPSPCSHRLEGTRKVKQSHVCILLACCLFLGNGTMEKVVGGGMGGPLGPIPKSSNT